MQGKRLSVETAVDRKIYRVPDEAQTALGTLGDVLNEIPSVDVDADGIPSLRGDTNVLVLIDGKPAPQLQGSAAGDNLQSMSAADIERIEILTTPPPEYKADGTAGVINIITRKDNGRQRRSGSLQASGGADGRMLAAAGGSYGDGKVSASAKVGFRRDFRHRTIQSATTGQDPQSGQIQMSRDHLDESLYRNVPSVDVSAGYAPDGRQSTTASLGWMQRGGLRYYQQVDSTALPSGVTTGSTQRLSRGHDPEGEFNATLRSVRGFDEPGRTLAFSLHRAVSHQHEHYDYQSEDFVPPAATSFSNLQFQEDHGVTEAGLDLATPRSKDETLNLGYSFEQDSFGFSNAGAVLDPQTGQQSLVDALTNHFTFQQAIHALYQSYRTVSGNWNWLGGLRTELTSTDARQLTDGIATSHRYGALFPSLHVERMLSENATLSLGASRRITRPDPSTLNPYVDHEYTPVLRAGNPNLKPQYTQSFEVGYELLDGEARYSATAYYRRNKDSMTDLTRYLGNGISLSTKTNLPRDTSAGAEFSLSGHILPSLSYAMSGNAFYAQIDASALGYPGLRSTTGLNAKLKLDYRPSATDALQFAASRTDKRLTPQGEFSAINVCNLGYKHTLSRSLSFLATVSDMFNGQHYRRFASAPGLSQDYQRSIDGRIVFAGLSYTFGAEKKAKPVSFDFDSGD